MSLPEGLYDLMLNEDGRGRLATLPSELSPRLEEPDSGEIREQVAEALNRVLSKLLDGVDGEGKEKTLNQIAVVNALLADLRRRFEDTQLDLSDLVSPPSVLKGIFRGNLQLPAPDTGLLVPWLFTAGKGSPSLLTELRKEIGACDAVDILVSFITRSGVRKLEDLLKSATAKGADGKVRTKLRILTTTYTGATDADALDFLAGLPGCEVRVSLDGRRTRLHAKAWIFHRNTGFGSAYVGSANLSGAALLGGLEWTVKFTQRGQEHLYVRSIAHFETLWNDGEFQPYDPNIEGQREQLVRALKRESGDFLIASPTFFEIEPKDYQRDMLERLANERSHGRSRNLVVAATGTGKTVVAAFDYRRICREFGGKPRLLFVAHRQEILNQARRTYREVLRDHSFGELLSGDSTPLHYDHLFATIDSISVRNLLDKWGADHWHTVVIDECHRLASDRFDCFARAVKPKILLGLTATPERSDGKPIGPYFDSRADGSPACELRLWHALDLQLLAPFEYYGCDDETDFSAVPWNQPGEISALDAAVSSNESRARLVIQEWTRLSGDPRNSRTLAFCVNVAHAEFMTQKFNDAGIHAMCVTGKTDSEERRRAPLRLQSSDDQLCVLVTCDLYNEGVDLPSVDTLLLLRPTQSPVLFQQQIGRGLRLADGKESCLVLDFVGRYRIEFRFDRLLGAITGLARNDLRNAVETGFSSLPPGCHIQLQARTRAQVLDSLKAAINQTWRRLQSELQAYAALIGRTNVTLPAFLRDQSIEITDLYRNTAPSGWTALKRAAGLLSPTAIGEEVCFGKRFTDLLHLDDPAQLEFLASLPERARKPVSFSTEELVRLQMLAYQVDGQSQQKGSGLEWLERLMACPETLKELGNLAEILLSKTTIRPGPVPGLGDTPLCLHASHGLREILTAVGYYTATKRSPHQSGVQALPDRQTELLFVTLDKTNWFSGSTAYHDYAISTELFHWQSQNSAGPHTHVGRRYIESHSNGWSFQLFVRVNKGDAYRACGPVKLKAWEGSQPMSITWKLVHPLPVRLFQTFSVLRGS